MKQEDKRPIGVFDSGVGGLTVLKAALQVLPQESYIYIGDTKNLPYGTKSPAVVRELALRVAKELLSYDIKVLVVACNTVSAVALPEIKKLAKGIPVLNVIDPTVGYALLKAPSKHVAVIATETTTQSGIYARKIKKSWGNKYYPHIKATPLLVPLIEEVPHKHPLIREAIAFYLSDIKENMHISTLILGCTHYPLIKNQIELFLGPRVRVIDSAYPTALALKELLTRKKMLHGKNAPTRIFFTSDDPKRSIAIAKAFIGGSIELKKLVLHP
jgi:glutamate racemase